MKTKILKIKVGSVFINGKSYDVFQDAWQKQTKNNVTYYEIKTVIFVNEVEEKGRKEIKSIEA